MSAEENIVESAQAFALQTDDSVQSSEDNISLNAAKSESADNQADGSKNDDVNQPKVTPIPEKVAGMLEGFGQENPSGEDPRYGDEFVLIKSEIDKLAFNDYNAVLTLCEEILKSQAKDMRVAGYFLLANTYINGLKGLHDGLMLYRLLLEKFADSIYPIKESARAISLQWLNHGKLLAYTKQHQEKISYDLLNAIGEQVELLNKSILTFSGDESLGLGSIYNWVKETRKKVKPPAAKPTLVKQPALAGQSSHMTDEEMTNPAVISEAADDISDTVQDADAGQNIPGIAVSAGMSDSEVTSLIRKLVAQLNDRKDYLRSIALARASRWSAMTLPPNEKGKTRLTPPRQTGVNEIRNLLAQEDYEAALRKVEGIFFEMAGHMLLDLQMYAHKAAKGMGKNDLANLIASETAALLSRLPGIEELRFDDDSPFANAETLGWLGTITGKKESATSFISSSQEDTALIEAINKAREIAEAKDLNAALYSLDAYRPRTEKQRFQLRLAMSQLCLDYGRPELAYPMLEDLMEQAKSTSLAVWDCSLAVSVAKQIQSALRSLVSTTSEQNRTQIEKRLEEVTAQMCRWDLALAAQIL